MGRFRQLKASFSKGEVSPEIEGRPDLVGFHNGCRQLENFCVAFEGGVFRRYGTSFIKEVKDSTKLVRLIPFKFNISQTYIIEAGDLYFRFYRRGFGGNNRLVPIMSAGSPVEVVTPYGQLDLADLQWAQSADILWIVHPSYQQRKLSRSSDTSWALNTHSPTGLPTFAANPVFSAANGWPSTVDFHQGRLWYAGTPAQPTTFWGSKSQNFDDFTLGTGADNGVQYTIANRSVNIIEWIRSLKHLFIGDAENEHLVRGKGIDEPIGGDNIPFVSAEGDDGSISTGAIALQRSLVFIQRSGREVSLMAYDVNEDSFVGTNLMTLSRHLGSPGLAQHIPVYAKEPDHIVHFVKKDGHIAALTIYRKEQLAGWSHIMTDGVIESVAAIPNRLHGIDDVVYLVKRTINGITKRYIEIAIQPEDTSTALANRAWRSYQTDCGIDGLVDPGASSIAGFSHLESETVDIVLNQNFVGQAVVTGGVVSLPDVIGVQSTYEIGLHYKSILQTLRPSIVNVIIDGLSRRWKKIWIRLVDSIGGKVNGEDLLYPPITLDTNPLRNGDIPCSCGATDRDGYITVEQDQPYPFHVTSIFGTLDVADND